MQRPQTQKRRTERTREALLRSFTELVLTRGYEQLSVNDVAARAGIGRSTLYTHFAGLTRMLEASLEGPCTVLAGSVRLGSSPEALVPLLQHFQAESNRNPAFFREPIRSLWSRRLARTIAATLRRDPERSRHCPAIRRDLLPAVLAELQLAIICQWLANPSSLNAAAIAHTLSTSTRRLLVDR